MTMSTLLVQLCKLKKCMRINVVLFSHLCGRPRKLIQRVKTERKETQTKCKVNLRHVKYIKKLFIIENVDL